MIKELFKDKNKKIYFSISRLNTQFFFFVILPLSILLIIITIGSMRIHQNAMRNLVGERDLRTVRSASKAIFEQLNHHSLAIQNIYFSIIDNSEINGIIYESDSLINYFDVGVAVISQNGQLIEFFGNDELLFIELYDEIESQINNLGEYHSQKIAISEPFQVDNVADYYAFTYYKLNENSQIIIGVFSITNLARNIFLDLSSSLAEGSFLLVEKEGNILFTNSNVKDHEDFYNIPGVTEALRKESGTTYYSSIDGEHVVAFSPIELTEWAIVIDEAWDSVASPILKYSESASFVLIPVVIISIYGFWLISKNIIQPLNMLEKQAVEFSYNKKMLFKDSVGGIDEIQSLQKEFYSVTQKLMNAQNSLRNYLGMVTLGQEEERNRLARELHDETLQSLIALNQRIMLIKRKNLDIQVTRSINEIELMITESIHDLRNFTKTLRPIYLEELGLVTAIESIIIESNKKVSFPIIFTKLGNEYRLSDKVEIAIYRIIQESINNIIKHANASKASVLIKFTPINVEVEIEDNGNGFVIPDKIYSLSNENHFGLIGIIERVELIGAEININSNNNGTKIFLEISSKPE